MGHSEEEAVQPKDHDTVPRYGTEEVYPSIIRRILEQVVSTLLIAGILGIVGFGINTGINSIRINQTLIVIQDKTKTTAVKVEKLRDRVTGLEIIVRSSHKAELP